MLVNIHQTKTNLSKLIKYILATQEEIIVGKMGKPVAKLVPFTQPKKIKAGALRGKIIIKGNFDKEDPEVEKLFYE